MKFVPWKTCLSTRMTSRFGEEHGYNPLNPEARRTPSFIFICREVPADLTYLRIIPVTAATPSARTCLRPAKFQHPRRTHYVQKVDVHNERWRSHHSPAHARRCFLCPRLAEDGRLVWRIRALRNDAFFHRHDAHPGAVRFSGHRCRDFRRGRAVSWVPDRRGRASAFADR